VAEEQRPVRHHVVDVAAVLRIVRVRTLGANANERITADAPPGAYGRTRAAGKDAIETGRADVDDDLLL
jgi:hypothetical protein